VTSRKQRCWSARNSCVSNPAVISGNVSWYYQRWLSIIIPPDYASLQRDETRIEHDCTFVCFDNPAIHRVCHLRVLTRKRFSVVPNEIDFSDGDRWWQKRWRRKLRDLIFLRYCYRYVVQDIAWLHIPSRIKWRMANNSHTNAKFSENLIDVSRSWWLF